MTLRELIDDARAVAPPCPALVGLGRDDSGAEIFVDLEAAGVVDVGAHESGLDAARHLTATLAVTPLADELRVVTVGEVLPELAARHEVRAVPDLPTAVADSGGHDGADRGGHRRPPIDVRPAGDRRPRAVGTGRGDPPRPAAAR